MRPAPSTGLCFCMNCALTFLTFLQWKAPYILFCYLGHIWYLYTIKKSAVSDTGHAEPKNWAMLICFPITSCTALSWAKPRRQWTFFGEGLSRARPASQRAMTPTSNCSQPITSTHLPLKSKLNSCLCRKLETFLSLCFQLSGLLQLLIELFSFSRPVCTFKHLLDFTVSLCSLSAVLGGMLTFCWWKHKVSCNAASW